MQKKFCRLLFLPAFVCLFSCYSQHRGSSGVEAAMKKYDALILQLDAAGIAHMFTEHGRLGNMATGQDSIRKFLSAFKGISVLTQSSVTDSIILKDNKAVQQGHFRQSDIISGKDTVLVKGTFTAHWIWAGKNGWRLESMETLPLQ